MKRLKKAILLCVVMQLSLALLLLNVRVATAGQYASSTWKTIQSPNIGTGYKYNELLGVDARSTSDAWTVGNYYTHSGTPLTLTEHWNGTNWKVIPSPNTTSPNTLYSVASVATNDVWAVGIGGTIPSSALIEHWNGTQWSIVPSPAPGSTQYVLNSVAAISTNNIWAVGFEYFSNGYEQTHIEHWNGTQWMTVASPNIGVVYDILGGLTVVSANNIWAVGWYLDTNTSTSKTLVEHWNGTQWSIVPSPNVPTHYQFEGSNLASVVAVSANDIWTVGTYITVDPQKNQSSNYTLTEHWNGTQWSIVPSPNADPANNTLLGVTKVSANDIWAVGNYGGSGSLIEQWNGTKWSIVPSAPQHNGSTLAATVVVPGSSHLWAVGSYNTPSHGVKTFTEYYL